MEPSSAMDVVKNLRAIQIGRALYSNEFISSGAFAACFGARKWRDTGSEEFESRTVELKDFKPEFLQAVSVIWEEGNSPFRTFASFKKVLNPMSVDSRDIMISGIRPDSRVSLKNVTAVLGPAYSRDTINEDLNEMYYIKEPWNKGPIPDIQIIKYQLLHSNTEESLLTLTFNTGLLKSIRLNSSSI